ncbi:3-oxoacyl-ACP reductase FabG [archaeon]|nr:3-oxoacyl-ACP reductase FabG [archaeon]
MISLEGKTAIITGASRGLGKGIALELAREKMNIVLNYVADSSRKKAEQLQKEIENLGSKSTIVQADVSKESDCKKILEETLKEFNSVFLLANNAGVYSSKPGTPTWDLDEKEFDRIFDTNVKGLFFMTKFVGKWMIDNKVKGSIVNIASVAGLDSSISGSIYGASKSAVIGFTKTWSKEFGENGIRVNAVAPGPILTDLLKDMPEYRKKQLAEETPLGRLAQPQDIGETVVFLAKNEAINGQTIVVDGGRVRH